MFIVKKSSDKSIAWPVYVEAATDGGKISKFEFTGMFKRLSDDEREEIAAAATAGADQVVDPAVDTKSVVNAWKVAQVDTIMLTMTGWKGVVDENKNPIEFGRDNLLEVVRSEHGVAILRGLNNAVQQINIGASAKN